MRAAVLNQQSLQLGGVRRLHEMMVEAGLFRAFAVGGGSLWLATNSTQPGPSVTMFVKPLPEPLPPKSQFTMRGSSGKLLPLCGSGVRLPDQEPPSLPPHPPQGGRDQRGGTCNRPEVWSLGLAAKKRGLLELNLAGCLLLPDWATGQRHRPATFVWSPCCRVPACVSTS